MALKVPEPYAVKVARTVLRGRKLPGALIFSEMTKQLSYLFLLLFPALLYGQADSIFLNSTNKAILGIITDPDNYSIIRASPNINSDSINYIKKDEIFAFIPDKSSKWFAVYKFWNIYGFIHKSRVVCISNLTDNKIKFLSYKIINEQLRISKEYKGICYNDKERYDSICFVLNNYHDSYYRPFLKYAVDYMIKSEDSDLIKLLVNVIYYLTGSADEEQSFEFARLVVNKPHILVKYIKEYKSSSLNEYILNSIDYYEAHGYVIDDEIRKSIITN